MEFNPVPITKGGNVNTEQENVQVDSFTAFKKQCEVELITAGQSPSDRMVAMDKLCGTIRSEASEFVKEEMIDWLSTASGAKVSTIRKSVAKAEPKSRQLQLDHKTNLPEWVSLDQLLRQGFVMNATKTDSDKVGIYFGGGSQNVERLTNFTVKPLYFIMDPQNPRRLIEVFNGYKKYVIELSSRAFVSQDAFEVEVMGKPGFFTEPGFSKIQYKKLINWVNENTRTVYELKTLGWQSEGFFAFSNKLVDADGNVVDYDEYGIAMVKGVGYLSPANGAQHTDIREEDSVYENDRYLAYAKSPIDFKEWAALFCEVYQEHAPFGIAFLLIAAFKDIASKVNKIPILSMYGPKGSGKSAMAESMMWFFFSGKNSDGKLIQGYNLNPGQGTPFSFFSRLQRFRNVFMLYNEHDPNINEPWKRGAFKSSYDGEGREIGMGESGKKRKTEIQKVNCVVGLAGQYLDTTDDGSLLSRSVAEKFSDTKAKIRTDEQKQKWMKLTEYENQGISSLVVDLMKHRHSVVEKLKDEFWSIQSKINKELKAKSVLAEARVLNNYSMCLAMVKIMSEPLSLPFKYDDFYNECVFRIKEQSKLLKDNNILTGFWNSMEVLQSDGYIKPQYHFAISNTDHVKIKKDGDKVEVKFGDKQQVLYIRLNLLHSKYADAFRKITGKSAPDIDTVSTYLKDQPYFIGLCPAYQFKDMNTSCYALNYTELKLHGVVMDANGATDEPKTMEEENNEPAPF